MAGQTCFSTTIGEAAKKGLSIKALTPTPTPPIGVWPTEIKRYLFP